MSSKPGQIVKIGRVDHTTAGRGGGHRDRVDHRRSWQGGDRLTCGLGETLRHFLGGHELQDLRLATVTAPPFRDHCYGDGDPQISHARVADQIHCPLLVALKTDENPVSAVIPLSFIRR